MNGSDIFKQYVKDVKEKPLKVRYWNCPVCNSTHDRDINASKNILREGLRINALA